MPADTTPLPTPSPHPASAPGTSLSLLSFLKPFHRPSPAIPPTVPLVVRVGFAGSRTMFDLSQHPDLDAGDLMAQVSDALMDRLRELRAALGLSPHHFLCGVSQIAVGADTLFTRACQTLGIAQRVLLPQEREDYLAAVGTEGPDFTPEEEQVARGLLGSPHIIEECVVSHARDRSARFEETNTAILEDSDIVICLVREAAGSRRGGTEDLISQAEALGKPVTRITVAIKEGKVQLSPLKPLKEWLNGSDFALPSAPRELSGLVIAAPGPANAWPTAESFIAQIKGRASELSKKHSGWFKRSAIIIISFHLGATVVAILAGKLHETIVPIFLSSEFLLLVAGLAAHFRLHRGAHARVWAVNRLVAETMRSLAEVERLRGDVTYPLELPVPDGLVPLLRTSAVLHLRRDRSGEDSTWTARRDAYIERRLTGLKGGQLAYYETQTRKAELSLKVATWLFRVFSSLAIVAAVAELLLQFNRLPAALVEPTDNWGNTLAVFMPVAAVGFLSWAAASDLEARAQTFAEMHAFLERQLRRLNAAGSERGFSRLVRETESRLLGENLNWFWRRSFTSVT
ncbi:hypothetical protein OKW41_008494 [Paraburkholderia sp. UCT70]|uniref:hypothetical protein n=1 Tax=Paraburkholderia sp. UCT70 TaxID=2991068 RepID=UPI003D228A51